MFSDEQRLNLAKAKWRYSGADFSVSDPLFKLIAKRTNDPMRRFGFLISGKVGKAAVRNRSKRYLTECVRDHLEEFPEKFDYIFIAHPEIAKKTHEEICSSVDKILPKVSLLR